MKHTNQKTAVPTGRPRGRPVETGQQNLKTQILDTAEQLFTDLGYAATSIRRIADTAGVNPALIHYYFGNKHLLLQSVLERSLQPMAEAIASLKDGTDASVQHIACLLIAMAAKHPNIPRLLAREVFLPGGEMQDYFINNLAPKLGGALPALLEREKSAGRIRHDADPVISALMIIAVCVFPFIARALAEPVLGVEFDADGVEKLTHNATQLLKRGLTI